MYRRRNNVGEVRLMENKTVAIGIAVVLLVSLGLNGYLYLALQRSPNVIYVDAPPANPPAQPEPSPIVVHVSGAVAKPSVYSLPAGSRVQSVIEAAGGALEGADLTRTNLARLLVDGEQVHIFLLGDTSTPEFPSASLTTSKININTATQKELETLPGIGPAKAGDIIAYRTQNGPFRTIDDIINVRGIGDKTFESLKELIRIN